MELQWVEPEASSPTTIQPINRIRVWGIGLENDRQFGYVARDQVTKKHKCHVFRCEMPARAVAKALLENHQKMSKAPPTAPVTTTTTATPGGGVGSEQTAPQQRSGGKCLGLATIELFPSASKHTGFVCILECKQNRSQKGVASHIQASKIRENCQYCATDVMLINKICVLLYTGGEKTVVCV
jgi:hypothetical protein